MLGLRNLRGLELGEVMNCYRHPASPAVGLCKSCYKALCSECAVDIGKGLACKNSCEENVRHQVEMSDRALKLYGIGAPRSRTRAAGVIIWFLMALGFWVLFAMSYFRGGGSLDYPPLVLAVVMTAAFALVYSNWKRYWR